MFNNLPLGLDYNEPVDTYFLLEPPSPLVVADMLEYHAGIVVLHVGSPDGLTHFLETVDRMDLQYECGEVAQT